MTKLTKGRKATLRLLLDIVKPRPTLGKRGREDEDRDDRDKPSSRAAQPSRRASSETPAPCSQPACIALQNEDLDEDAIVITALNAVPFCCHADLVTMNRTALLGVAHALNAQLPLVLQIDTNLARGDAAIRHSIELLVGIRSTLPPAPRRLRSRSVFETPRGVPPSPASPLAGRSRSNMSLATPALAMLREEDEGSLSGSHERPQKRRRTIAQPTTPTLDPRRPITRSQSRRVAPMMANPESPTVNARILRTRSQTLPERAPLHPSIHTNLTVSRGRSLTRGRSGYTAKKASFAMTSTPKKRAMAAVNSPAAAGSRYKSLVAGVQNAGAQASGGAAPRQVCEESAEVDVTFGIDGLTMPITGHDSSDMDISSG